MRQWDDHLWLFTVEEYEQLPDGIELITINGKYAVKGKHNIDMDTRWGYTAYGVNHPMEHDLRELFMQFILET